MGAAYIATDLDGTDTVESEDAFYTKENLQDPQIGLPFRFADGTGGWIERDLGADPAPYDTVALLGHNLASTATVSIQAGAMSNPGGSPVAAPSYQELFIWADVGTRTDRYVRITISDANGITPTAVGRLMIASRVPLPRSPVYGVRRKPERSNLLKVTARGPRWGFRRFKRKSRTLGWKVRGLSEVEPFETLEDLVAGNAVPFLLIPDVSLNEALYGRMVEGLEDNESSQEADPPVFDLSFGFDTETPGVDIGI